MNIMHIGMKKIEKEVEAAIMIIVAIAKAMKGSMKLNTIYATDFFSLTVMIASS